MSEPSNSIRDRRRWLAQRLTLLLSAGTSTHAVASALSRAGALDISQDDAQFAQKLALWTAQTYPRSLVGAFLVAWLDRTGNINPGDMRVLTRALLLQPDAFDQMGHLLQFDIGGNNRPLGNGIRRGVRDVLESAPPNVIATHDNSVCSVTTRDALRLSHPRAASPEAAQAFKEICERWPVTEHTVLHFDARRCEAAAKAREFTAFECIQALCGAVHAGARVQPYLDVLRDEGFVKTSRMPASFWAWRYYSDLEGRCGEPVRQAVDAALRTLAQNEPRLPGCTLIFMEPSIWRRMAHESATTAKQAGAYARMAAFAVASIARASENALIVMPSEWHSVWHERSRIAWVDFTPTSSPLDDVDRILAEGRHAYESSYDGCTRNIASMLDTFRLAMENAIKGQGPFAASGFDDSKIARVVCITENALRTEELNQLQKTVSLSLRENPPYTPATQHASEKGASAPVPYWLHVIQSNGSTNTDAQRTVVTPRLRRTVLEGGLPDYAVEFIAVAEKSTDAAPWDNVVKTIEGITW